MSQTFTAEEVQAIREQYEEELRREQARREELEWAIRSELGRVREAELAARTAMTDLERIYSTLRNLVSANDTMQTVATRSAQALRPNPPPTPGVRAKDSSYVEVFKRTRTGTVA